MSGNEWVLTFDGKPTSDESRHMQSPVTQFATRRADVGERLAAFRTHGEAAARNRGAYPTRRTR